ncbi:pyrroline 5-carboyxlate reductase [Lycorma delicatula]|uniref:pyrroline 5-carboyxlate reductase n=1 Tax=Lycorma delicatula TaxID=130591 RepID=UPI003F514609
MGSSGDEKNEILLNVGFIGAGNMAKAIGEGLINAGVIRPTRLYASAPSEAHLKHWKSLGINTTSSNREIVTNCPIVILAVKPQYAQDAISSAFSDFSNCAHRPITLVSILAGQTIENLEEMLYEVLQNKTLAERVNVIRTMPNTPLLVGEGCTVFSTSSKLEQLDPQLETVFDEHKDVVKKIFSVNGYCEEVSEYLINPIGALSGSGPAYVYQIIEAMSDGAVKLGVPRSMSYTLAAQTLLGSAKMVLQTGRHPGELKDEVCSPGGTTIAGISAMERVGVRHGIIEAIEAAFKKSEELAKKKN